MHFNLILVNFVSCGFPHLGGRWGFKGCGAPLPILGMDENVPTALGGVNKFSWSIIVVSLVSTNQREDDRHNWIYYGRRSRTNQQQKQYLLRHDHSACTKR